MKSLLKGITVLIFVTYIISCGSGEDRSHSDHHDDDSHSSVHSDNTIKDLRLNDGKKWKMDDHTRSSFDKMVVSFMNSDHKTMSGEDLKKAGSDLQAYIAELIKGCTMTGAAHDQLHVYLMGYIPAVDTLSKSGGTEDAFKVKHYLEIYKNFFE
jgi:hypothetical protein